MTSLEKGLRAESSAQDVLPWIPSSVTAILLSTRLFLLFFADFKFESKGWPRKTVSCVFLSAEILLTRWLGSIGSNNIFWKHYITLCKIVENLSSRYYPPENKTVKNGYIVPSQGSLLGLLSRILKSDKRRILKSF